jgi:hypothetical protein
LPHWPYNFAFLGMIKLNHFEKYRFLSNQILRLISAVF